MTCVHSNTIYKLICTSLAIEYYYLFLFFLSKRKKFNIFLKEKGEVKCILDNLTECLH